MRGFRGRGRRGRGGRGGGAAPSKPLSSLPLCIGYLRDDAVEVTDPTCQRELYSHGFFGKGTVSRRMPNQPLVVYGSRITPSGGAPAAGGGTGEQALAAPPPPADAPAAADPHRKRPRPAADAPAGADAGIVTESEMEGLDELEAAAAADAAPAIVPYTDLLSTLATSFERHVVAAALPPAYTAAATAAAHGHEPASFEMARMIAHYVSCPPPRLRHIAAAAAEAVAAADGAPAAEGSSDATGATDALAAGAQMGGRKRSRNETAASRSAIQAVVTAATTTAADAAAGDAPASAAAAASGSYDVNVFESGILEPEAAIYLYQHAPPGHFVVCPSAAAAAAASAPLPLEALWRTFCGRIADFPARYRVYAHYRDAGWVVRDGHAFGCDYALYARGPGQGHAAHCVLVQPLRVLWAAVPGADTTAAPPPAADGATARPPGSEPAVVRAQARALVGSWLDVHAAGRVINTAKKNLVLATATLTLPLPQAGDVQAALQQLATIVPLQHSAAGPACEYVYAPHVAQYLAHPACTERMSVAAAATARWLLTLESNKKQERLLTAVARSMAVRSLEQDASAGGDGGVPTPGDAATGAAAATDAPQPLETSTAHPGFVAKQKKGGGLALPLTSKGRPTRDPRARYAAALPEDVRALPKQQRRALLRDALAESADAGQFGAPTGVGAGSQEGLVVFNAGFGSSRILDLTLSEAGAEAASAAAVSVSGPPGRPPAAGTSNADSLAAAAAGGSVPGQWYVTRATWGRGNPTRRS